MKKQSQYRKQNAKYIFEELEPRQLFSGGIEGLVVSQMDSPAATYLDVNDSSEQTSVQLVEVTTSSTAEQQTNEIVFVDTGVENYQSLVDDLVNNADSNRSFEVVLLDSERNGIDQITEALKGQTNLDAIHIISHGSDGNVQLGNTSLNADTLIENKLNIALWANAFSESGDILLYGCSLADTEVGESLIKDLSALTLADVAASDDLTGNENLGGDWDLEYSAGDIEANVVFSTQLQNSWANVLVTPTITARETLDADGDGQIDQIRVTTDQNLDDDFTGLTIDVDGYTVTGYSSDVAFDNIFYADLTQSGTPDTGATPTVTVTTNTTLSNAGEENISTETAVAAAFAWGDTDSGMVTHAGSGDDYGNDIVVDAAGNTYVAGRSNDNFIVRKYDANGDLDLSWGDSDSGVVTYDGGNVDTANGITIDSSGNIYVAGRSNNGSDWDFLARKYDANGDLDTTWGDGDSGMVFYDSGTGDDKAFAITLDSAGNIYVAGEGHNGTDEDLIVRKYDANGDLDLTWGDGDSGMVSHDGTSGNDAAKSITIDASNNIYVGGYQDNGSFKDLIVRKYDANGDLTADWGDGDSGMVTFDGGGSDTANGITVDASNSIYVAANKGDGAVGDFMVRKYDANGDLDLTWGDGDSGIVTHDAGSDDAADSITIDSSNNIYVAGALDNGSDRDFVVRKYDANGDLATDWGDADSGMVTYDGGNGDDKASGITLDSAGNIYATGYVDNGTDDDLIVIKYDANGKLVDNPWLDANWLNRTRISFDNSLQVTDDLDDFPILITLNTTNIPGLTLSALEGSDVRFTEAVTGVELKYEVDTWNEGTNTATVWVKVPTITAGSATDYIYVYHDYDGTATYDQVAADEQAVWGAGTGVYHLDEDPDAGGADEMLDSDGTANHGSIEMDRVADPASHEITWNHRGLGRAVNRGAVGIQDLVRSAGIGI